MSIILYSPELKPAVYPDAMKDELLAQGYITPEAFMEIMAERDSAEREARLSDPAYAPELYQSLRAERDARLADTDYLVMPDYPITQEKLSLVLAYRQALRDLPGLPGAPFDGGGCDTPWPAREW